MFLNLCLYLIRKAKRISLKRKENKNKGIQGENIIPNNNDDEADKNFKKIIIIIAICFFLA